LSAALLLALAPACGSEETQEEGGNEAGGSAEGGGGQATNVGRHADVVFDGGSYVSPLTEVFGDVYVGRGNFIGPSSVLRAAPDRRIELGDEATIQDNAIVRAMDDSVVIGDESNLGHHAIVRNSKIGNSAYVGYNAEVADSRVGNGALVYHGARVEGVEIPENSYVGAGEVVTDQAAADDLPTVEEEGVDEYYQEGLLDIHRELTRGYIELYESDGYGAVVDVGPNPETSFNPEQVEPRIGENVELDEFTRVVGDVRVGEGSSVGRRTAIRADEGSPITMGPRASVDDRVTFHAVEGTDIRIGEFFVTDDDAVLHGPLEVGDGVFVGENAVVFRARLGDDVRIGEGATVVGPEGRGGEIALEIPDDTLVPAGAVVTSEEDVRALER
jgi:carbonic anhydrase/acetyltransferase-like protein (isoleucine patch superfamily)